MANKIFLDTNIVVDFIIKREFELQSTERIFDAVYNNDLEAYISESVISTSVYLLRQHKMDALEIFRELCKFLQVVPFNKNILYMPIEKFKDTEDGLLYFLANHHKLNYFITRNKKDFIYQVPSLPVLTPNEFIKVIF
ncbi:MAG: PIN domain-containing protein [Ferruginibacter sp.]|jgi:predicted nucleic acid-binding protein